MIRTALIMLAALSLAGCATPTVPPKADAAVLHRLIEAQTAFKTAEQLALACHAAHVPSCITHWSQIADIVDRGAAYEGVAVTAAHAGNSATLAELTTNFRTLVSQLSALGVPSQ